MSRAQPNSSAEQRARSAETPAAVSRAAADAEEARDDERRAAIAVAAYLRAESRGFAPGHELDDWLAAEMELAGLEVTGGTLTRLGDDDRRTS